MALLLGIILRSPFQFHGLYCLLNNVHFRSSKLKHVFKYSASIVTAYEVATSTNIALDGTSNNEQMSCVTNLYSICSHARNEVGSGAVRVQILVVLEA